MDEKEGDENENEQPRAFCESSDNEEEEEVDDQDSESEHQTLMDLNISSKLKRLMSTLKQSSAKPQLNKKEPKKSINSEKIRFAKSFKHFLKKKK